MIMYDDDTTLYCNVNRDISDQDINAELKNNKLSLNVKNKTYVCFFHTALKQ